MDEGTVKSTVRKISIALIASGALVGAGIAAKSAFDWRTNSAQAAAEAKRAETGARAAAEAKGRRAKRISGMAAEIKRCRAKEKMPEGCLAEEQKPILRKNAEDYESVLEFRKAGLIYVRLGDRAKAMEMQGKCANGITQAAVAPGFGVGAAPNEPRGKDPQGAIEIGMALMKHIEGAVAEYKRCKPVAPAGCPGPAEIKSLEESATSYETAGAYRKAGLVYVRLGNTHKAREMIERCRRGDTDGKKVKNQDPDGAGEIEEALKAMGEALERSVR